MPNGYVNNPGNGTTGGTGGTGWDLDTFLANFGDKLKEWGSLLFIILGVVLLIVAIYKLATGLMSHGKGQPTNWLVILLMFLFGGALVVAGTGSFGWVSDIAAGGKATIDNLGQVILMGTCLPFGG